MIKKIVLISIFFLMLSIVGQKSSIKMNAMLMILSMLVSMFIWIKMGTSWISLIFNLIMIGGILILFSMVSATSLNQQTSKKKVKWMFKVLTLAAVFYLVMAETSKSESLTVKLKWFYYNNSNMTLTMLIILMYFQILMKILATSKTSLRSVICHNSNNFVN